MLETQNPFVFGEVVSEPNFVDRATELANLVRDLADGQKIFLLSPRRFGKSSLVALAFLKLQKRHLRTVSLTVSSYSSYTQFLEKFAEKVLRAAGPWSRVKDWVTRFAQSIRPEITLSPVNGQVSLSFGAKPGFDPSPIAAEVFAMPGELARNAGFRMAICLDEFQQIAEFNGGSVENVLRNQVQEQREVGYVFSGSQPSLMKDMLSSKRPFHKAGPLMFLDKIPESAWREFIPRQFAVRRRKIDAAALDALFAIADLIPYDIQRIAHELWDYAELHKKSSLGEADVKLVAGALVYEQSTYYEQTWQQLSQAQRATLQALAARNTLQIFSQAVRTGFRLGPASTVQRAIESLCSKDILDRYKGRYFFLDPLFPHWIRNTTE